MEIGIGLPSTIPGVTRDNLLEWARRADEAGFSTLGTIDRIVYANWESLIALAAAAAVTERIRLTTAILIAPLRANHALLAKQAASIDQLSNGRLVLGLAVGGREDDYQASDIDFASRGRRFEEQLQGMTEIWSGEDKGVAGPVGPPPARRDRPALILGGDIDATFDRAARYADGWVASGGGPDPFAEGARKLDESWQRAGRDGKPRKVALGYFALGPNGEENARTTLGHYYAWLGDEVAGAIAGSAPNTPDAVKELMAAYEDRGCDELILYPSSPEPEQVGLLAEAAL